MRVCGLHGNYPYDDEYPCPECLKDASPVSVVDRDDVGATEPRRRGAAEANVAPVESEPVAPSPGLMRVSLRDLPTMALIPKLSQEMRSPIHLRDWCDLLDQAADGVPVRGLCAVPIRTFKSQTTFHGIVKILLKDPSTPIIHMSHSHERAEACGKRIRQLAESCDQQFGTNIGPERGQNKIADWRNSYGGGVVVMSADQSKLGYDCGALICDDPVDEYGAQDAKKREACDETISHYTARCMRKGRPGPVLIVASPWHPDDPMGRRRVRTAREWIYVRHPVLLDDGTPWAPDVWPLDLINSTRSEYAEKDPTERFWWAQLMCDPHPQGTDLFGEPTFYKALPDWAYRRAFGVDLAYTTDERNDWFARTVGRVYGTRMHLLDVTRHRIDTHLIRSTCQADINKFGRAPFFSYMAGPEIGIASFLNEQGIPIARMHARYNKLVRAQRTIARWNRSEILVPESAPWLQGFLHRVSYFRGREGDTDDDEIDALVSMCDGVMGGAVAGGPKSLGKAYPGLMGR